MKDEIFIKIRTDKKLRKAIAEALAVETETIYRQAREKAPNLQRPLVVSFIANYLGKTVKEISN